MKSVTTFVAAFTLAAALTMAASASAQTTAGSGSVVVLPVVAHTASFETEAFVRNVDATNAITVNVTFYEATNSGTPRAVINCAPLSIPANKTVSFLLGTECGPFPGGGHFGQLVLEDASASGVDLFQAYSRAQTVGASGGNGFSIEGFPVGNFSGDTANVIGIKRQAAAPGYQTNCFIGALSEPIQYQVSLWDSNNNVLGNTGPVTLAAFNQTRFLDVFAALGAAPGDYSNVRVRFDSVNLINGTKPSFVGFCTTQENSSLGSDFRIAKSDSALDGRQLRLACYGQDDCNTTTLVNPAQITDPTVKNIHEIIIAQPDNVTCSIVSTNASKLEMRLRVPGDPFTSAPFAGGGGNNQNSFAISTGPRSTVGTPTTTRWYIDVGFREGTTFSGTIDYGITCQSGNGTTVPWLRTTATDDF